MLKVFRAQYPLWFLCLSLFFAFEFSVSAASAAQTFVPALGSPERQRILAAVRAGLQKFPDDYSLDFQYLRDDVKIPPDIRVLFKVHHLKVGHNWAWLEAEGVNYGVDLMALLKKEAGNWQIMGLVRPSLVVCPSQDGLDVLAYSRRRIQQLFPEVPRDIFPPENSETEAILQVLRAYLSSLLDNPVFLVRSLKVKDNWARIETSPRSPDGYGQYEPVQAILRKVQGRWEIKKISLSGGAN